MVSPAYRTARLSAGAMVAMLIVVACGSGAATVSSPIAAPTPTASPTPAPTPAPSVVPSTSSKPDAAAALKIGAPYDLVDNPSNLGLKGSFVFDVAGVHIVQTMTGREIWLAGNMVGLALVLEFDGIAMTGAMFDAGAQGAANNTGGELVYTTILGNRVGMVTTEQATFGLYALDGTIVMVAGTQADDSEILLTSVISANK